MNNFLFLLSMLLMMVVLSMSMMYLLRRDYGAMLRTMLLGVVVAVVVPNAHKIVWWMTDALFGGGSPYANSTPERTADPTAPAPEPSAPSEPVTPAEPVEVPYDFIIVTAVVVAAFLLIAGTVYVFMHYWSVGKPKRAAKRLEAEQKQKALREEAERVARVKKTKESDWAAILRQGDGCLNRWTSVSTDLGFVLKHPMIANMSEPQVAEVVQLVSGYRMMRADDIPYSESHMWMTPLGMNVKKMKPALETLLSQAVRTKDKNYSFGERKQLSQARNLLAMAMDTAASANERQLAYERVRAIMEELSLDVSVELEEKLAIEMKEVLAIGTGPETDQKLANAAGGK